MKIFKICNLYSGLGGNRKEWDKPLQTKYGNNYEITAVELNEDIAKIYQDFFPNDKIIVADAVEYLLKNYRNFDFIWGSPPCPSHSVVNHFLNAQGVIRLPDMTLYQIIIFLEHFYKGKYCIENVKSYYKPLIEPQIIGRHFLWANFKIPKIKQNKKQIGRMNGIRQPSCKKTQTERNMVDSNLGLAILNRAMNILTEENTPQGKLF